LQSRIVNWLCRGRFQASAGLNATYQVNLAQWVGRIHEQSISALAANFRADIRAKRCAIFAVAAW